MSQNYTESRKKLIARISSKVSDIVRQLILAGIGIVWLFKVTEADSHVTLNSKLFDALTIFVISIILELVQYAFTVLVNGIFLCGNLKNQNMPNCISWFPWVLWSAKIVLMTIAYILIGRFLWS